VEDRGPIRRQALKDAPVRVLLIDRTNHHLFQPLLCEVAICTSSPAQIAARPRDPCIGAEDDRYLGRVVGSTNQLVFLTNHDRERVEVHYDYLILGTGATHSYFGHPEFAPYAPGLKSLADAEAIRHKILRAFEQADSEEDPRTTAIC
jgi:NADH dehydrogenase FAD-containing subunit